MSKAGGHLRWLTEFPAAAPKAARRTLGKNPRTGTFMELPQNRDRPDAFAPDEPRSSCTKAPFRRISRGPRERGPTRLPRSPDSLGGHRWMSGGVERVRYRAASPRPRREMREIGEIFTQSACLFSIPRSCYKINTFIFSYLQGLFLSPMLARILPPYMLPLA